MTRKGNKSPVKSKKATINKKTGVKSKKEFLEEVQKRIVKKPTIEIDLLDSDDDDFAVSVPKVKPILRNPGKKVDLVTKEDKKTPEETISIPLFPQDETDQEEDLLLSSSIPDGCSNHEELDQDLIFDIRDESQEEALNSEVNSSLSCVRICSSSNSSAVVYESKDAWKNLMQRMQSNQKVEINLKSNPKGKGRNKTGSSKPSVLLPNRIQPKVHRSNIALVDDDCAVQFLKTEASKTILSSSDLDQNNLQRSYSPPKRLKMDESVSVLEGNDELTTQQLEVFEQKEEQTSSQKQNNAAPFNPNMKIPTMFLKPEERAARALQEKLEKAKICESICPQEVLAELAKEPVHYTSASSFESSECFNGNVVKLNEFVPLEDPYGGVKTKQCPFYKKLPGTKFSVDAFNYGLIPGIEVYFLSHYHSDHYIGLTKKFCKTLVCSPPTANLVRMKLGVDEKCIRRLQLNKPYIVDGVEVVLISANHCPGSVMFIFKLANGTIYFHTGDFRFTVDMLENHYLQGLRIDLLYLDTTYCDPKYDFPTQTDAITELIAAVKRKVNFRPKTLILCGSYLIGKERVYFSLAEALQTKVFMNSEKRRIIHALENPLYDSYVSAKEETAQIHVTQMFSIEPKFLSEYLSTRSKYTHIIGIKPSGWQFSSSGSGTSVKSFYNDTVTIIGVPYSEHSSYSELEHFITATKPKKIQPTVNVGSTSKRTAMMEHITKWQAMA